MKITTAIRRFSSHAPRRLGRAVLVLVPLGLALAGVAQAVATGPVSAQFLELRIVLSKTATVAPPRPGGVQAGDTVTYTYTVTNNSSGQPSIPFDPVTIIDDRIPTSPFACGTGPLDIGESRTCTSTYVVTAADVENGRVVNVATATGQFGSIPVTSSPASVDLPAARDVELSIDKQARVVPIRYRNVAREGDRIHYSYLVTNTGDVTITDVTVSDPRAGEVVCPTTTLEPGESVTCRAVNPYVVTRRDVKAGRVVNVAQASGQFNQEAVFSPLDSVTVRTGRGGKPWHHPGNGNGGDPEQLPVTGDSTRSLAAWGGGMLALGTLLVGAGRTRRRALPQA